MHNMKKGFTLLGLIFALGTLVGHAQIYQMYSQDFETGTPQTYTVTGNGAVQTSIYSGGSRAMKMTNSTAGNVIVTLDTIDFSTNAGFNYYTLEFSHIAFFYPNDQMTTAGGIIEVKLPINTDWTTLTDMHYNTADGGSSEFVSYPSWHRYDYQDWSDATAPNNMLWKSERFDLENVFNGVPPQDRKLLVRFVLPQRATAAGGANAAWFIDDIKMRASSQQIVAPIIRMSIFPDNLNYPSSRGAKVAGTVTTAAMQGINPDSVFVEYTVGSSTIPQRAYMQRVGTSARYVGYIPFYGYDTLMTYHIVARDMTTNNNTAYYPKNEAARLSYKCVRGTSRTSSPTLVGSTNSSIFPFPAYADNRSEYIYDSIIMDSMGFRPGAITTIKFRLATANNRTVTRQRFQVKMANMSNSMTRTNTGGLSTYLVSDMQVVYDSTLVIGQAAANSLVVINLQDTFHYAGSDLLIQVMYHNPDNPSANPVVVIPAPSNKQSVYHDGMSSTYGLNPFNTLDDWLQPYSIGRRPWLEIAASKNLPLIYDCGISSMAYPSFTVPAAVGTDSVSVWLRNFGVNPVNAVRIAYSIDNGPANYYNWTGSLTGGDSIRVCLSTTQNYTLGYHTVRAWVEDSLTSGGTRYRDHEPYNNSTETPFVACMGPYSGVLTIGSNASDDFLSLERCLFSLSRCGIDGPVTIKMPSGTYPPTTFPLIPGTSATNYVLFEPATAGGYVCFRRPASETASGRFASLVNMNEARSIRFRNIRFANSSAGSNVYTNSSRVLVKLGSGSAHCQFLNCTFIDSASLSNLPSAPESLISTGYADSVLIEGCTFFGGQVGIDVIGAAPDNRSTGNIVRFNELARQVNTGISVVNQNHVLVDSNMLNDVRTNASYVLLCQYVYESSRIVRNRVYSTKGASCIGVSDMHGTATDFCYVANNMLLSLDDGSTNQLTTPLNMIKGSYVKVCFNSVRLRTHTHVNVAAATLGGGIINHCYFQNNVVASFDTLSHAFAFIPTLTSSDNVIDHNCYYSTSGILNKYSGVNYSNLTAWTRALPMDVGSVNCDPGFTNSSISLVDLRSFNAQLRWVGVPIPGIVDDIEGSIRNATAPSLGAYEVVPLTIDFKPETMISPFAEYCGAPTAIPVEVAIRNIGTQAYTYSSAHPLQVHVYVTGTPNVRTFTVNRNIPADDTIHFLSTITLNLPANTDNTDRTYRITWWVTCNLDPDNLNDTAIHSVISRFAPAAPTSITQSVAYNNTLTITPTAGINTWPISYYISGQGRTQRSGIYWYNDLDDTVAFHYGPSYTTPRMHANDTLYISQKRNLPLVKITEVQVVANSNQNAVGRTNPLPSWMSNQTALAVELTNCGDYPADIEGDSIVVILPTSAAKIWRLPHVVIQPGACLVLQFKTGITTVDSTRTIGAPSASEVASVAYNANFAILYRDGRGIADAVAFNNVTTASSNQAIRWNNQNVPAAVWQGTGLNMGTTLTAGAYRVSWPTDSPSAGPTPTATLWQVADNDHPMHIGTPKPHLVLYHDNGCYGNRAPVRINVTGIPTTDVSVEVPVMDTGCNLSTSEQVHVTLHNYGTQATSAVTVNYSLNGSNTPVCTNTIQSIPGRGLVNHTFTTPVNMHQNRDSVFHVKVWIGSLSTDAFHTNDTNHGYFLSRYTPNPPSVTSPRSVHYAQRDTISVNTPLYNAGAVWYNSSMEVLDTTAGSFITPRIYYNDTFYVTAMGATDVPNTHIGTLATVTNNNYPSPYNPKTRHVKEQYLFTAAELQAAGHGAGTISSVSFYLESVGAGISSFTFSNYAIKIGTTTASTFANNAYVTGLTQVYQSSNLTLTPANCGWVRHTFTTPFVWDGVSNIVVEVCRSLNSAGIANGANTRYTAQPNTVITKQHASTAQDSQTSGAKGNNRPDIMFGFLEPAGCESPAQQILVNVINLPAVDANFHWDPALDTMVIASCASTSFSAQIENSGLSPINAYSIAYQIDGGAWQTVSGTAGNLTTGQRLVVPLVSTHLVPGRHRIRAAISVAGDTVPSNDTIDRVFNVRFCTGTYTIGATTGNDYPTIQVALDTLHNAGVAGAITFRLDDGTYNGQYTIGRINGSSYTKTVRFVPAIGANQVKITYTPNQTNNYVMRFNGATNVIFDSIYFYASFTGSPSNVYTNVLRIDNSENVTIRNSTIRTRSRASFANTSNLVVLGDGNEFVTIDHCLLDSGYYQVTTFGTGVNTGHHLTVNNSDLVNFHFRAIDVRNIDTVQIQSDSISAQMTVANKPLVGIRIANAHNVAVKKNFVLLMDNFTGGKAGIQLYHCTGTNVDRVTVNNNMVSLKGTGTGGGLIPSGILVDSNSTYVSVYFNSVRLNAGTGNTQKNTKAFHVERSSHVFPLNNIFMNESQGYAYYVAADTCIQLSNYNVYWSNSDTTITRKFAYWGKECPTFDSLRTVANSGSSRGNETNSMEDEPPYESERDLRMHIAAYAGLAQYNSDVTDDIFDSIRPQIPTPTIGCHEFTLLMHNVAIYKATEPMMPSIVTGANAQVYNIETDSIMVRVKFYNNGMAPETHVHWYAILNETNPLVRSVDRPISLPLRTVVEDSVKLFSPLGVVDSQKVIIYLILEDAVDADTTDNFDTVDLFIYPAYDLKLTAVSYAPTDPPGCRMNQVPITYTLQNVGKKAFPGNFVFNLGYFAYCHTPSGLDSIIPNLPATNEEPVSFGDGNDLPEGTTRDVTLSAPYQPNLFPTGQLQDITVRLRGWVTYEHDVKPLNDTSNYINIASYHTPEAPIPHDTVVDYGTFANLFATQNASRPISWGRDSSGVYFFHLNNATSQYIRSTHWEARQTWRFAPPYIHDTTFYICCFSSRNCTSYYSPINVTINPAHQYDVAIGQVLSPRGEVGYPPDEFLEGRVYHEVDTVTLRIVNYGSMPISNIPVGFKFMDNNMRNTYLEAYDTVRVTIPGRVGDNVHYYDFTFPDSVMLQIPQNPLGGSSQATFTYSLNAWVNHPDDQQHNNDTLSTIHKFKTYAETAYDTIKYNMPTSDEGFDITRVAFDCLDNEMPDMFGYHHRFLGSYNPANAAVPTLYVRRGTTDTLFVEVSNNVSELDSNTPARLYVAIDFNRNGHYADGRQGWKEVLTCQRDTVVDTVVDYFARVRSRRTYALPFTIPDYAHYGYMRMLVLVDGDTSAHPHVFPRTNDSLSYHYGDEYNITNGQAQEYLLFVQEPGHAPAADAAIARLSYPHKHILQGLTQNVGVILANKGDSVMNAATVTAEFFNEEQPLVRRTFDWAGSLEPGQTTLITFDSIPFGHGTTWLNCWVDMENDTVNKTNDTISYQYHIFDTITLFFNDDFDLDDRTKWYAPVGNSLYTRNLFERATPVKSNISGAYSAPNTYVTDATRVVTVGNRGNRSLLYSPVFNISAIKPDTVSFLLSKNLLNGSSLHLEYNNYLNEWLPLDDPEAGRDSAHVSWYDSDTALTWTGSSPAGGYETKLISSKGLGSDFRNFFQVRFVYEAPYAGTASASYGDGAAIDDFKLGRARRPKDCGVIAFTYPESPQFGQTIYPKVLIRNYGTDVAYDIPVAYHPYGTYLPIEDVCHDTIQPDSVFEFTFTTPFIIRNTFPDTFSICGFTNLDQDIYNDNDTACAEFGLTPLDNDMYMYSILSPLNRAVAGDSIPVRVRLRNFGQAEVDEIDVVYVYNGEAPVTEHINFVEILGHPLASTEFYDHVFSRKVRATMGTMELTTWLEYRNDSYPYNDTLSKQIVGINSVTDVAVKSITALRRVDLVYFIMVLENQGARMVNNFKVGFWMDNDSTRWWSDDCQKNCFTRFEETFYRDGGLPGGGHATHIFSVQDTSRTNPRKFLTAYAIAPGDQDHSNDTTYNVVDQNDLLYDIQTNAVEIEENETDSCRVRLELENIGDLPYIVAFSFTMTATINDQTVRTSVLDRVDPGNTRRFIFNEKILKDLNRHYAGTGSTNIGDDDRVNNTTSLVRVLNYFEGAPVVRNESFTLAQNYPNPFDGTTRIEFNLPSAGIARFCVTDALGRQVYCVNDYFFSGTNTITFNRDNLPAGVYYYSVEYNGERRMKKMILR